MNTIETKRNAVMTLIEPSVLLSYQQKLDLIDEFPKFSEDQLDVLGGFLSMEERIREEFPEDIQTGVETVLSAIVGKDVGPESDNTVFVGVGKPTSDTTPKTQ